MEDITTIVSKEIIDRSFDQLSDVAEFGLDQFLKDGFLKDVPFLSTVLAFYNVRKSVLDRRKVKNIITFFQELNSGEIKDESFNIFRHNFTIDSKYKDDVVETILVLNERFLQIEKSKILANLVLAHINGELSWKDFTDISYTLDAIHPKSFFLLKEVAQHGQYWKSQMVNNPHEEAFLIASGIGYRDNGAFAILEIGQQLYNFGIKPSGL